MQLGIRARAPLAGGVKVEPRRLAELCKDLHRALRRQQRQRRRIIPRQHLATAELGSIAPHPGAEVRQRRKRAAQANPLLFGRTVGNAHQPDRVAVFGFVEHPSSPVERHVHVDAGRLSEHRAPELLRTLGGEGAARQHHPDAPAVRRAQAPEAPAERLIQVRVSRPHARKRAPHQRAAHPFHLPALGAVEPHQIGPRPPQPALLRLLLPLGQRAQPRMVTRPERMLLHRRLLPRRIAQNHVEPRPLPPQKNLGKRHRKVHRAQPGKLPARLPHRGLRTAALRVPVPLLEGEPHHPLVIRDRPRRYQVAQRRRGRDRLPRFPHRRPRPRHVAQRGVVEVGQPVERLRRLPQQTLGIRGEQRVGHLLELAANLLHRADADQRVAVHQPVVEHRQRQARHEGVNPHRQPRELHRQRVQVYPVDAAPRDQPPQQLPVLNRRRLGQLAQLPQRRRP